MRRSRKSPGPKVTGNRIELEGSLLGKPEVRLTPAGTPVRTAGEGVVLFAGPQSGYGLIVVVRPNSDAAFIEFDVSAPALASASTCAPEPCA